MIRFLRGGGWAKGDQFAPKIGSLSLRLQIRRGHIMLRGEKERSEDAAYLKEAE